MSIRITKDGWSVEGDTLEELRIGIRAVQLALDGNRAVTVAPPRRGPGRPPGQTKNGAAKQDTELRSKKKRAIAFLKVIRNAGPEGIDSTKLADALEMGHGREIGGVLRLVNGMLESQEIGLEEVYRADQFYSNTPKTWFPGDQIDKAIAAIKQL